MNNIENLKKLFTKKCVNRHLAIKEYPRKIEPMLYRRGDLTAWAKEAFDRGEVYFYCEPIDPNNPYGKLRLCEPKYEYVLNKHFSEEEFNNLFDDLKNDDISSILEQGLLYRKVFIIKNACSMPKDCDGSCDGCISNELEISSEIIEFSEFDKTKHYSTYEEAEIALKKLQSSQK